MREPGFEEPVPLLQLPVHPFQGIDILFGRGPLCALGAPGALFIVNQNYDDDGS
jgi:hypothetical protein